MASAVFFHGPPSYLVVLAADAGNSCVLWVSGARRACGDGSGSACCCATTGALVGSRNALFDDGYMLCIIQGGFWKNVVFYMIGSTRLLRSILRLGRHIVNNGSGMFLTGFAGIDASRAAFP